MSKSESIGATFCIGPAAKADFGLDSDKCADGKSRLYEAVLSLGWPSCSPPIAVPGLLVHKVVTKLVLAAPMGLWQFWKVGGKRLEGLHLFDGFHRNLEMFLDVLSGILLAHLGE
ncbi:hypothetical protein KCU87_g48, partial [Aureobasidium melanogenum]